MLSGAAVAVTQEINQQEAAERKYATNNSLILYSAATSALRAIRINHVSLNIASTELRYDLLFADKGEGR